MDEKATSQNKYAPKGGIADEVLEILVEEGASLREMAAELDRSPSTIRYWLRVYGMEAKPRQSGRRRAATEAHGAGLKHVVVECRTHGFVRHVVEDGRRLRCVRCRSEAVSRRRRKLKRQCDPELKVFGLSQRGLTRSIAKLREEAAKCVLLCANCHAEIEWGDAKLPPALAKVSGGEPPPM